MYIYIYIHVSIDVETLCKYFGSKFTLIQTWLNFLFTQLLIHFFFSFFIKIVVPYLTLESFVVNDMQPPPPLLKIGQIESLVQKVAR